MQSTESRKDRVAADLILSYLEDRGFSPEAFSRAAFNDNYGYVSGRTIRRVVEIGIVPSLRVRGVIARQMHRSPSSIWRNAPVVAGRKTASRSVAA